jgi:hypothetical protein
VTAYILRLEKGHDNYAQYLQVAYWFAEKGQKVHEFDRLQLEKGKLDKILRKGSADDVFYGSVPVIRLALNRAGRPQPPMLDYPAGLERYLGRRIVAATLRDVIRGSFLLPFHLKPRENHKLFTGLIVRTLDDLDFLIERGTDALTPVYVSEYRKFKTEWRAMILRGEVLNVSCYYGEPLVFPDPGVIKAAVGDFRDAPVGYAMDWAVTNEGETVLIEVNDGFGLGNYGCRGPQYIELVEARWREMMEAVP